MALEADPSVSRSGAIPAALGRVAASRALGSGVAAVLVGVAIGLAVALLALLVRAAAGAIDPLRAASPAAILLAPALAGAVAAAMRWRAEFGATGLDGYRRGTPEPLHRAAATALLGAVYATFGGVVGRHEPMAGLVASIGWSGADVQRAVSRTGIFAAATAAAFSGALGSLVVGAFVAVELCSGRLARRDFLAILASSLCAGALSRTVAPLPTAPLPPDGLGIVALVAFAVLGALLGATAIAATGALAEIVRRLPMAPIAAPILVGLLIGGATLVAQPVIEFDASPITALEPLYAAVGGARVLLLAGALGAGGAGGPAAPLLSGAGLVAAALAPLTGLVTAGSAAVAAMSGALAVAFRSPLAAVMLAAESTGDLGSILAIGGFVLVAGALATRADPATILDVVRPEPAGPPRALATLRVSDVMVPAPRTLLADDPVAALGGEPGSVPVLSADGKYVGMVSLADAERARLDGESPVTVGDVARWDAPTAAPFQSIEDAFLHAGLAGTLPVLDPAEPGVLAGVVLRATALAAAGMLPGQAPPIE